MVKTMRQLSKRTKIVAAMALIGLCGMGGVIAAQLYLSIVMDSMNWSMATNQLMFAEYYDSGGSPKQCVDYDVVSGVISGTDNQTFTCTYPWYPDLLVEYEEVVSIYRTGAPFTTGEGAIDITWDGLTISDVSGLVTLELWGFRNGLKATTMTKIVHWNTTSGAFELDNDMDFIEVGLSGGIADYIVLGIKAEWTGNVQPFTVTITSMAG